MTVQRRSPGRWYRRGACALLIVHGLVATAAAQDSAAGAPRSDRLWPTFSVRAGTPAVASIGVGAVLATGTAFRGPFVSIEPGVRAGRASIGYSKITGDLAAGPTVRASFLRRYRGTPLGNYAGLELQYVAALVGPRLGVFRSVDGGRRWLLAADFGVGF